MPDGHETFVPLPSIAAPSKFLTENAVLSLALNMAFFRSADGECFRCRAICQGRSRDFQE